MSMKQIAAGTFLFAFVLISIIGTISILGAIPQDSIANNTSYSHSWEMIIAVSDTSFSIMNVIPLLLIIGLLVAAVLMIHRPGSHGRRRWR